MAEANSSHVLVPEPDQSDKPDKPEKLTSLARKSVSPPVLSPVYDERRMSTASKGKSCLLYTSPSPRD